MLIVQNLCKIVDEREELLERIGVEGVYFNYMDKETEIYPIAIRISPYTSRRTIEEYIGVVFSGLIKAIQEKYRDQESKLGKTRMRNKTRIAINKRVYELRHLPHRKIAQTINDEFNGSGITISYEEISNIIFSEVKRRK